MAHKVFFHIPQRELGKGDIMISVYRDTRKRRSMPSAKRKKEKLGDLLLSKGGIDWFKKGIKTRPISRSWKKLAAIIENS